MQNSSIEVNSNLINDFDLPAGIEIAMDPATGRILLIITQRVHIGRFLQVVVMYLIM